MGGGFGAPCSISSGIQGKLMGADYDNEGMAPLSGVLSTSQSDWFPNFTHDIKSFPADETSDYVAIAGGSYGCRVLKHTSSGVTNFAHLVGSCNRLTTRKTYNVCAFGCFLQQEIWIGDSNGYRYGYDEFGGLYGVCFFRKNNTTYLVTACGINGLDLWDLDSSSTPTLLVSGAGAGVGIFKKVAVDKRLRIVCVSAGYEQMPAEYKSLTATDMSWKMASQPEATNPELPQAMETWYTSVWDINLNSTPSITSRGEFRFNADGGGGTVPSWTEQGGGGNDIIYMPEPDIFVYSYSYHGWNINHAGTSSPSSYSDITNLVLGGGMNIISYNPGFDIYIDEPYHNHPCGQLSPDLDGNVYWASLSANASNSEPLLGVNESPTIRPASSFLEFLNSYKTTWKNHSDSSSAVFGCGDNDRLEFYVNHSWKLALYTWVTGSSINGVGKDSYVDCVYGTDLFDEDDGTTWTPLASFNTQGQTSEQRIEYFGGGATGVSYCGDRDWLSLWQDGFVFGGVSHVNSIDERNILINYDPGYQGTLGSRLYGAGAMNFAPSLPCGRSTASRFGVIITLSLENSHGDMGPGYYGFTTTGQGALQDAAQLLQASDNYYGKIRGIIY